MLIVLSMHTNLRRWTCLIYCDFHQAQTQLTLLWKATTFFVRESNRNPHWHLYYNIECGGSEIRYFLHVHIFYEVEEFFVIVTHGLYLSRLIECLIIIENNWKMQRTLRQRIDKLWLIRLHDLVCHLVIYYTWDMQLLTRLHENQLYSRNNTGLTINVAYFRHIETTLISVNVVLNRHNRNTLHQYCIANVNQKRCGIDVIAYRYVISLAWKSASVMLVFSFHMQMPCFTRNIKNLFPHYTCIHHRWHRLPILYTVFVQCQSMPSATSGDA